MSEGVSEVAQSCSTLCDPVDCSPPGSSIHGILQARILEWVAIPFSRGSSRPMNPSLYIAGRFFTIWATTEAVLHGHLAASQNLSMNALWPSISTSRVLSRINWYLKNLHNCTDTRTGIYVAALFATVRSWKQPLMEELHRWWWYIHKMKMLRWGTSEWGNSVR